METQTKVEVPKEEKGEVSQRERPTLFVPGSKRKPRADLTRAKILIYGPPKIGKSTLASKFPGAWFLLTEEGVDWLELYEPTPVTSWDQFLQICGWIDTTKPRTFGDGAPIRTIVIDTVDLLFKMCDDYMRGVLGISSMGDLDWGKGWSSLSDEFSRVIAKISHWPYGLIFISHSKEREIKSKSRKIDRIEPALMTTGFKVVHALCDLILYCYVDEYPVIGDDGTVTGEIAERRMVRCQPSNNVIAGDRSGKLPEEIPLSYDELVKYYPDTAKEQESTADMLVNT